MADTLPTIPETAEERYRLVERAVEAQLGRDVVATYMNARNFALGGCTPAELVSTDEGVRQVLAELSAHVAGGPL